METLQPEDKEQLGLPAGTLGDVLYPDRSKQDASEREWVALVRSIAAGDQLALHALYERAHRVVFTLTMRITGSRETAEELTLDVFHDVWRRAAGYDTANGTVLGWIMNQARSRAIDRVRFENRKKRVDPGEVEPLRVPVVPGSDEFVELREHGEALRGAMGVLSPAEREVIEAAYFSDLTHTEIATRFGHPLGTVKTRIRSALHKLRQALGEGKEAS